MYSDIRIQFSFTQHLSKVYFYNIMLPTSSISGVYPKKKIIEVRRGFPNHQHLEEFLK